MDEVTQHNAALVEGSAAAVASLAEHAHSLNMLIVAFKAEHSAG